MSERPVPDSELYKCTREELYNRIYTLRENEDALRKQLELALSHDTQPYPTVDAYEKVCAALGKTKKQLEVAKKAIDEQIDYNVNALRKDKTTWCEDFQHLRRIAVTAKAEIAAIGKEAER